MSELATDREAPRKKVKTASSTLATTVYDRIRSDILSGALSPEKKLRTEELRELYEAGNSPIREALNRLSSDGFVVREEQRGFHVASVSRAELHELVKTRCWLEETALRQSIANGDDAWEEKLVVVHHRLSKVPRFTDEENYARNPEWETQHREFHMALISACGSRWLIGFCEQLHDQSDRYRQLAVATSFPARDPKDEHLAIFSAAIARDADTAVDLLCNHYKRTAKIIDTSGSTFID
ncbi:MAG: GntR family transcriptional regulator [Sneathiella sp.]